MKYYEELKKKYYETFPEELKVEKGCVIRYRTAVKDKYPTAIVLHVIDRKAVFNPSCTMRVMCHPFHKLYQVLGIDIDVREVLRMSNRIFSTGLDETGYFLQVIANNNLHCKIDLSLPLKEQEEVCRSLLELLK